MLNRAVAPKSHLPQDIALSRVELNKLANGIEVHSFRDATNPVIKIDIVFPFGKKNEKIAGLMNVGTKLMADATLSYPADELQETLDQYGAHLDLSVDYDDTTFSILCLKEHFSILLPLLKSIITEPLLEKDELERIKFQLVQKLRVNNSKNNIIASKAIRSYLLQDSPYAHFASEASINKIQKEDVQAMFSEYFNYLPNIVIAGDLDNDINNLLDSSLGTISYDEFVDKREFELNPKYQEVKIDREGSVQASIRMGMLSIPRNHPDYFKLNIANEILGGYFGSRLMKNIREDKGYTYGIYSSLINYQQIDLQVIGADVQIDSVDLAIEECQRELKLMQSEQVSESELTTVKNYMLGKFASHLDNVFSQADNYKSKLGQEVGFHDYFNAYVAAIREVNANEIKEISQKYFSQELAIVKVY